MDVHDYLKAHGDDILRDVLEFASIPSVNTNASCNVGVARAAQWVAQQLAAAGPLEAEIIETGTPIRPRNFERSWGQLKKAAKMPDARLHDLRHLHVSLLVKQGIAPQAIAERVGHTDASFTLRRYSHMFEEHRERTAISLDVLLGRGAPARTKTL